MTKHYELFEGGDKEWPEWCFTTHNGIQVTVTSTQEGTEVLAKYLAERLLDREVKPPMYVISPVDLELFLTDRDPSGKFWTPGRINDYQRQFEKALEWGLGEDVTGMFFNVADDIEREHGVDIDELQEVEAT